MKIKKQLMFKTKEKNGFTLIELVIVVAIIGILTLVSIPKVGKAHLKAKQNADMANAKTIANAANMAVVQDGTLSKTNIVNNLQSVPSPKSKGSNFVVEQINEIISIYVKDGNDYYLLYPAKTYPTDKAIKSSGYEIILD
ncbi:type II secretion system protein [Haloimpatiens sp. FM7315]|uniref:type II secretion system protein n=1 Tax=Haloimpatiens sp. FM7315 TaxID=3298609 RepID=UPI0035A2984A